MNTWTRMTRRGKAAAASAVAGVALLGFGAYVELSTPKPPSCAKPENQNGMGTTALSDCLTQVGNWCQKNYPDDSLCQNRVYGYAPGKPGDSD
ncbi:MULTISPECIES: hypothetical protein [Streptomyces]|uniref:hypothetical protein n=1 Tax=Streptomyces TaxID=1883 RepID=UPI0005B910C4|nr:MULTISPECIES: hypothetical protein [Streptomyces]SEC88045.1 hypothetical protein SAMN05216489_01866 [Streptomyces sp. 3213] [Streptomyces sp. 3213.3]